MERIFKNKKIFILLSTLIIVVFIWMFISGGIKYEIKIFTERTVNDKSGSNIRLSDSGSVEYVTNSALICNIIIVVGLGILLYKFYNIQIKQTKIKHIILTIFIIISLFIPIICNSEYENAITIAGEREDMRTYKESTSYSIIEKIIGKQLIEREKIWQKQ